MIKIKIMTEFLHSPIWTYEDGIVTDEIPLISEDEKLQVLSKKIEDMFSSYYEFDSHNQACWFNYEQEKADKEIMLDLITQLISRLHEINDGSFIVEDLVTERLKQL